MGRDRQEFERTIDALRKRLIAAGPLQGAPLLINFLAADLGVSQTPVREALAWLAGEGLIGRERSFYVGATYGAADLADRYELAMLLVLAAYRQRPATAPTDGSWSGNQILAYVVAHSGSHAFGQAFKRVLIELEPLAEDEAAICGDPCEAGRRLTAALAESGPAFVRAVRRHHGRRIARSGEILAHGLLRQPRI